MNAVETLQAAIDKLSPSREGPWWIYEPDPTAIYRTDPLGWEIHVADTVITEDRDLIVTLHRTIDAQLALLSLALDYEIRMVTSGSGDEFATRALALASAIVGDPS